LKDTQLLKI